MARVLAPLALIVLLCFPATGMEPLLSTDFEQEPLRQGWWRGAYPNERPAGRWTDIAGVSGRHCLEVRVGWWASPRIEVQPLAYYRLRFSSMVEGKGLWVAQFYDLQGNPLDADHYTSFDHSVKWSPQVFCFRSKVNATTMEVRFRAVSEPVYVDDVTVEPVSRAEVAQWADAQYAAMPPIDLRRVPRAGPELRRSLEKLRAGKTLRIVMLGDSIINDTGNSPYDVLVERNYPGARVEVITSVRGGTGCWYYQHENRVQTYVLDHRPDLLMIGGISHNADVDAVRSVIRQVRAKTDPEILLMSGPVGLPGGWEKPYPWLPEHERAVALQKLKEYRPGLARLAREYKAEYFDVQALWEAYEHSLRSNPMWLRRDPVHANERGRAVLAQIMAAYFGASGGRR